LPRHALVFAEVALASVLLIGCALMLRSFSALLRVSPGFVAENVVLADYLPALRASRVDPVRSLHYE
jgi:hypothetical protein